MRSPREQPSESPFERRYPNAVRVGQRDLRPPTIVKEVTATYPNVAAAAKVTGPVSCEIVVGQDGKVAEARVLRSIPLLDQAALEAVRQWQFDPGTVNGKSVPVIMTVRVNFK